MIRKKKSSWTMRLQTKKKSRNKQNGRFMKEYHQASVVHEGPKGQISPSNKFCVPKVMKTYTCLLNLTAPRVVLCDLAKCSSIPSTYNIELPKKKTSCKQLSVHIPQPERKMAFDSQKQKLTDNEDKQETLSPDLTVDRFSNDHGSSNSEHSLFEEKQIPQRDDSEHLGKKKVYVTRSVRRNFCMDVNSAGIPDATRRKRVNKKTVVDTSTEGRNLPIKEEKLETLSPLAIEHSNCEHPVCEVNISLQEVKSQQSDEQEVDETGRANKKFDTDVNSAGIPQNRRKRANKKTVIDTSTKGQKLSIDVGKLETLLSLAIEHSICEHSVCEVNINPQKVNSERFDKQKNLETRQVDKKCNADDNEKFLENEVDGIERINKEKCKKVVISTQVSRNKKSTEKTKLPNNVEKQKTSPVAIVDGFSNDLDNFNRESYLCEVNVKPQKGDSEQLDENEIHGMTKINKELDKAAVSAREPQNKREKANKGSIDENSAEEKKLTINVNKLKTLSTHLTIDCSLEDFDDLNFEHSRKVNEKSENAVISAGNTQNGKKRTIEKNIVETSSMENTTVDANKMENVSLRKDDSKSIEQSQKKVVRGMEKMTKKCKKVIPTRIPGNDQKSDNKRSTQTSDAESTITDDAKNLETSPPLAVMDDFSKGCDNVDHALTQNEITKLPLKCREAKEDHRKEEMINKSLNEALSSSAKPETKLGDKLVAVSTVDAVRIQDNFIAEKYWNKIKVAMTESLEAKVIHEGTESSNGSSKSALIRPCTVRLQDVLIQRKARKKRKLSVSKSLELKEAHEEEETQNPVVKPDCETKLGEKLLENYTFDSMRFQYDLDHDKSTADIPFFSESNGTLNSALLHTKHDDNFIQDNSSLETKSHKEANMNDITSQDIFFPRIQNIPSTNSLPRGDKVFVDVPYHLSVSDVVVTDKNSYRPIMEQNIMDENPADEILVSKGAVQRVDILSYIINELGLESVENSSKSSFMNDVQPARLLLNCNSSSVTVEDFENIIDYQHSQFIPDYPEHNSLYELINSASSDHVQMNTIAENLTLGNIDDKFVDDTDREIESSKVEEKNSVMASHQNISSEMVTKVEDNKEPEVECLRILRKLRVPMRRLLEETSGPQLPNEEKNVNSRKQVPRIISIQKLPKNAIKLQSNIMAQNFTKEPISDTSAEAVYSGYTNYFEKKDIDLEIEKLEIHQEPVIQKTKKRKLEEVAQVEICAASESIVNLNMPLIDTETDSETSNVSKSHIKTVSPVSQVIPHVNCDKTNILMVDDQNVENTVTEKTDKQSCSTTVEEPLNGAKNLSQHSIEEGNKNVPYSIKNCVVALSNIYQSTSQDKSIDSLLIVDTENNNITSSAFASNSDSESDRNNSDANSFTERVQIIKRTNNLETAPKVDENLVLRNLTEVNIAMHDIMTRNSEDAAKAKINGTGCIENKKICDASIKSRKRKWLQNENSNQCKPKGKVKLIRKTLHNESVRETSLPESCSKQELQVDKSLNNLDVISINSTSYCAEDVPMFDSNPMKYTDSHPNGFRRQESDGVKCIETQPLKEPICRPVSTKLNTEIIRDRFLRDSCNNEEDENGNWSNSEASNSCRSGPTISTKSTAEENQQYIHESTVEYSSSSSSSSSCSKPENPTNDKLDSTSQMQSKSTAIFARIGNDAEDLDYDCDDCISLHAESITLSQSQITMQCQPTFGSSGMNKALDRYSAFGEDFDSYRRKNNMECEKDFEQCMENNTNFPSKFQTGKLETTPTAAKRVSENEIAISDKRLPSKIQCMKNNTNFPSKFQTGKLKTTPTAAKRVSENEIEISDKRLPSEIPLKILSESESSDNEDLPVPKRRILPLPLKSPVTYSVPVNDPVTSMLPPPTNTINNIQTGIGAKPATFELPTLDLEHIFKGNCFNKMRHGICFKKPCRFRHDLTPRLAELNKESEEVISSIMDYAITQGYKYFCQYIYSTLVPSMNYASIIVLYHKLYTANMMNANIIMTTVCALSESGLSLPTIVRNLATLLRDNDNITPAFILQAVEKMIPQGCYWVTLRDLFLRVEPPVSCIEAILRECIFNSKSNDHIEDVMSNFIKNLSLEHLQQINSNLKSRFNNMLKRKNLLPELLSVKTNVNVSSPLDLNSNVSLCSDTSGNCDAKSIIPSIASPDTTQLMDINSNYSSEFRYPFHEPKIQEPLITQSLIRSSANSSTSTLHADQLLNRRRPTSDCKGSRVNDCVKRCAADDDVDVPYNLYFIEGSSEPKSVHRDRFWKLYLDVESVREGLKHQDYEHVLQILNKYANTEQTIFANNCYKMLRREVLRSEYHITNIIRLSAHPGAQLGRTLFRLGSSLLTNLADAGSWVLAYRLLKSLLLLRTQYSAAFALLSAEICLANDRPLKALAILKQSNLLYSRRSRWLVAGEQRDEPWRAMVIDVLLDVLCKESAEHAFAVFEILVQDQSCTYYPTDLITYADKVALALLIADRNDLLVDLARLIIRQNLTLRTTVYRSLVTTVLHSDIILAKQLLHYGTWLGIYPTFDFTAPIHVKIDTHWTEEEMYLIMANFLDKLSLDVGHAVDHLRAYELKIYLVFDVVPVDHQLFSNHCDNQNNANQVRASKLLMKSILASRFSPPIKTIVKESGRFVKLLSRSVVDYLKSLNITG